MATDRERLHRIAETFFAAWNRQDVDEVLRLYTDDVVYRDPTTRGPVRGAEALRRYLTKLFAAWNMSWRLEELLPFEGRDGAAVRWSATIAPRGVEPGVPVAGLDLVFLDGDRVARNEVFFDRSLLAPLLS